MKNTIKGLLASAAITVGLFAFKTFDNVVVVIGTPTDIGEIKFEK